MSDDAMNERRQGQADMCLGNWMVHLAKVAAEIADRLEAGTATDDDRRAARMYVRLEKGIPERGGEGEPQVITLNLEAWIVDAQGDVGDAGLLWRDATRIDERFIALPVSQFADAISNASQGRGPALTEAAKLVIAAGIYKGTDALGTLRQTASNLKSRSRAAGLWRD